MRHAFVGFFAIFWILSLFSCKRGVETERVLLSDEELAFVPYEAGDTIPFMHSNGYPFDFKVVTKERYLSPMMVYDSGKDFITFETLSFTMKSVEPDLNFSIMLIPLKIYEGYNVQITLNGNSFMPPTIDQVDFDSILINNKMYYQVMGLGNSWYDSTLISIDSIYYNRTQGLIKIGMTNDEAFYLNR
jgi:hypothetical protein